MEVRDMKGKTIGACPLFSEFAIGAEPMNKIHTIDRVSFEACPSFCKSYLSINLVMAADIKQNYLFFKQCKCKRDAITVGEPHSITTIEPSLQGVKLKVLRKRVLLQIGYNPAESGLEIGMAFKKLTCLPQKLLWSDNAVH